MEVSCWNTIGVRGDGSCPELQQHIHCRNCPVYATAAITLLESAPSADDVSGWTAHVSEPRQLEERHAHAAIVFRIGAEWLALLTSAVSEVLTLLPIHSLPHRRHNAVLGVANVRGELVVCTSLGRLLGIEGSPVVQGFGETRVAQGFSPASDAGLKGCATSCNTERQRMLLVCGANVRVACPVDAVQGIHTFHDRDLKDLPATLAKAATRYSKKLLRAGDRSVGLLDDAVLLSSLKRSLA